MCGVNDIPRLLTNENSSIPFSNASFQLSVEEKLFPITNLELRDVIESDLSVFFEHQLDREANHMSAFTALKDPNDRSAFDAHWKKILADKTWTIKPIVLSGQVAGHVGCFTSQDFGKLEVFYRIGREFWGRGVATNALSKFLHEMNVRPIYAHAAKDNRGSFRVLEKCNFKITAEEIGYSNSRNKEIEWLVLMLD